MVHNSRNSLLVPGISRFSRSQMYAKKAMYKKQKSLKSVSTTQETTTTKTSIVKQVGGAKNGKTRSILSKSLKYYPAENVQIPLKSRKSKHPRTKLRSSIKAGTVLVLLAGRYRGKRVVFLKQLESGLLLVSGPFALNGVPLRRVNQAYVLATSTQVDISSVPLSEKLSDSFFTKQQQAKTKTKKKDLFEQSSNNNSSKSNNRKKEAAIPEHVQEQKIVDSALVEAVKAVPQLSNYLKSTFSLQNGQYPHLLQF